MKIAGMLSSNTYICTYSTPFVLLHSTKIVLSLFPVTSMEMRIYSRCAFSYNTAIPDFLRNTSIDIGRRYKNSEPRSHSR